MKNSIQIITLAGCEVCKSLVKSLHFKGVYFSILSAEVNNELCDRVEDLLKTNKYPIAIVNNNHYYYITHNSDKLGVRQLANGAKTTGCASVESMIEYLTFIN